MREGSSGAGPERRALVREIILEDFMSYEYGRIPLRAGLNLVCGPNGAGKSSILLALSVALGQAYTERSRKLSDLIRRGRDLARVTLLLDNTPVKGKRPIPRYDSDLVRLSRYMRRDGLYWYEAEYREIAKADVAKLFSELGINPDNMLIIMHQNMIEEFSVITPAQRLKMVEDAVGFQAYRERILEAYRRLTGLLSEEESLASLIANAEQTLAYWQGEYERYLRRRELLKRKSQLECEEAWAHVIRLEKTLQGLRDDLERKELRLKRISGGIDEAKAQIEEAKSNLNNLRFEQKKVFLALLEREREKAGSETALILAKDHLSRLEEYRTALRETVHDLRSRLEKRFAADVKPIIQPLEERAEILQKYEESVSNQIQTIGLKLPHLEEEISTVQSRIGAVEEKIAKVEEEFIAGRVNEAVQIFKKETLEDEAARIAREIKTSLEELRNLTSLAEKKGQRIETRRNLAKISEDLKLTSAHLASLGEVSEDAEKAYKNYLQLYEELKGKAEVVSGNRQKALEEIEVRKRTWKEVIQNFLEEVNPAYQELLAKVGASGGVKLVNAEDIETAGLELQVGFRGSAPTVLDAYTQSGGERTTAIMAFLLALQQHLRSPIRAVDEFEIHMDPRNREIISQLIVSSVKERDVQYVVITPGQIASLDKDTYIITVQKVEGRSEVRAVA